MFDLHLDGVEKKRTGHIALGVHPLTPKTEEINGETWEGRTGAAPKREVPKTVFSGEGAKTGFSGAGEPTTGGGGGFLLFCGVFSSENNALVV